MGLRLQRQLGPVQHLTPGQWTIETASGRPAIRCPACGGISDLDEAHRVLTGGVVSPIWSCPFASCAFQEFLSLEAYGEAVLR